MVIITQILMGLLHTKENDFIPFEKLTEEIVINWVKDYLGVQKIEEFVLYLTKQIKPWQKSYLNKKTLTNWKN